MDTKVSPEAVELADRILHAAGSGLRYYTIQRTRDFILATAQSGIDEFVNVAKNYSLMFDEQCGLRLKAEEEIVAIIELLNEIDGVLLGDSNIDWYYRSSLQNRIGHFIQNNPASLSEDGTDKATPLDAQIASMTQHAAPVDAPDGGGINFEVELELLQEEHNELEDEFERLATENKKLHGRLSAALKELEYIATMTHKNAWHSKYFETEFIRRTIAAIHTLAKETLEKING